MKRYKPIMIKEKSITVDGYKSPEGNHIFTQTYIQQLLKDGDWRKAD